eukprot:3467423-Rhodomonas_salina.3
MPSPCPKIVTTSEPVDAPFLVSLPTWGREKVNPSLRLDARELAVTVVRIVSNNPAADWQTMAVSDCQELDSQPVEPMRIRKEDAVVPTLLPKMVTLDEPVLAELLVPTVLKAVSYVKGADVLPVSRPTVRTNVLLPECPRATNPLTSLSDVQPDPSHAEKWRRFVLDVSRFPKALPETRTIAAPVLARFVTCTELRVGPENDIAPVRVAGVLVELTTRSKLAATPAGCKQRMLDAEYHAVASQAEKPT